MIIVKLMGGLGNQMFQYAAARRLAHVHGASLKLNLGWYKNIAESDTARKYALNVFAIKEEIASPEELQNLRNPGQGSVRKIIQCLANARAGSTRGTVINEKHYHFDPDIMALPDNVSLEGYWQSEKYFKDIEEIIRNKFTVKFKPDALNRELAETIKGVEAVSIHVRRGDYVSNPAASRYHGTCSLDYYRRAIDNVLHKTVHPHFFVFSDDPSWVKNNLKMAHPVTFAGHNGPGKDYEDLRLMTLCRYHIIANSSFSWWGAWLNHSPDKTVIAPSKWFNDPAINTCDLIPDEWQRL